MCFDSGSAADDIAQQTRADEIARQNRIKKGMADIDRVFQAFNPAFYQKRYDDYMGYASPEIERQQDLQKKQLVYALARTGNLDSSAAIDKNAELIQEGNKERLNAANQGLNEENNLRSQVEQTRGNLVSELNATGNNQAASASAMRSLQNLNQPPGFSPLGTLFLNFANSVQQIGSRAANSYSGFAGGGGGASLFGGGGGSMRVIGG